MTSSQHSNDRPVVLLATRNAGKVREILEVLGDLPVQFKSLEQFASLPEAEETGKTFAENARIKAVHYSALTGLPAIAEDSGLEVDALGGLPGVNSARFAGRHGDDAANNAKLLEMLRGVPDERRTARFRCVCVLAEAGQIIAQTEGVIEGVILHEPRGTGGFGYDPLFFVPDLGRTTAEISVQEKNAISHRGRAIRAMRTQLLKWLERRQRRPA